MGKNLIKLRTTEYSRGDQIRNADFFGDRGAALLFNENKNSEEELLEIITELLDNKEKLQNMGRNMSKLGMPDAAETIAKLIEETLN